MTDEELIAEMRRMAGVMFVSVSDRDRLAAGLLKEAADRLAGRVTALELLHQPITRRPGWPTCSYDNHRWPCPEVAAIGGRAAGQATEGNHG